VPALLGMLLLVFFPFFYGIALSFTNANLYNTDKSIYDTWIGLGNFTTILTDFGIAKDGGRVGLELPELLLHPDLHHRLDDRERRHRRDAGADPGVDPEPQGL